jgi:hypothetical protein
LRATGGILLFGLLVAEESMQHPTWKFSGDWRAARKFLAVADGRISATGTVGHCGELSAPATGVQLSSYHLRSAGLNLDKPTHHVNKYKTSTNQLINDDNIIT